MANEELNPRFPFPDSNYFIVMWCATGLECVVDITQMGVEEYEREQNILFDTIKQGHAPKPKRSEIGHMLGMMTARARFNPQRNYEIYSLRTDKSIDKAALEAQFDDNPQAMVDLIRETGVKLYSDRNNEKHVIR